MPHDEANVTTMPSGDMDAFRRLVRLGNQARQARDWILAAQHYSRALEHRPDHAGIWMQLGHSYKEAGSFDRAEEAYLKAQKLNPTDADVPLQLGHLCSKMGDFRRVGEFYSQARELGSTDPHAQSSVHSPHPDRNTALLQGSFRMPVSTPAQLIDDEDPARPTFGFTMALLPDARHFHDSIVVHAAVSLIDITSDNFLRLAEREGLRFLCRIFATTSDSEILAEEWGEAAPVEVSPWDLTLRFSFAPSLFVARPPRLIHVTCAYRGGPIFSELGQSGTVSPIALALPESVDLFAYYFSKFNAERSS